MKKIILNTLFLLSIVPLYAQYDSIYFEGMQRTYLLHLPQNYDGIEDLPLVIAMHGGFGSGPQLEDQSQLSQKADDENFIVVYPEGVLSLLNIRTWNAGECCGYAASNDIDDVGFIDALIDSLLASYTIDSTRIYATGMSNGAFMSYRLACELSDRIAAIAPVAASMTVDFCNPDHPVPIIHFHSYQDSSVPYLGGYGDGVSNHYNPPLDSVFNVWSQLNDCQISADTLQDNNDYTHVIWDNCACLANIEYFITHDGGHSWPGGQASVIGDPVSQVINANDLMWSFFEEHTLGCNDILSLQETPPNQKQLKVFPNPTTGTFILVGKKIKKVIVYDYEGRKVFDLEIQPSDMLNISLAGEAIGTYFVKVQFDENKEEILKIVLQ